MSQKRREQILDAAIELIAQTGLGNLSLKQIAARVGFKDPAIYRHFESKNDILKAIIDRIEEGSLQVLKMVSELADQSPLNKIKAFFFERVNYFKSNPALTAVMFSDELFLTEPTFRIRFQSLIKSHEILILDLIREGQKSGEIRLDIPSDHLFLIFIGTMRFLIVRWLTAEKDFDLLLAANRLWETIYKVFRR